MVRVQQVRTNIQFLKTKTNEIMTTKQNNEKIATINIYENH